MLAPSHPPLCQVSHADAWGAGALSDFARLLMQHATRASNYPLPGASPISPVARSCS